MAILTPLEKADKIALDIEYLFSKINWQKSYLDARAVQIMNSLNSEINLLALSVTQAKGGEN